MSLSRQAPFLFRAIYRSLCAKSAGSCISDSTILRVRSLDASSVPPQVHSALSLSNASRSEKRRARKDGLIEKFGRSDMDTGSPEVQIALWTDRIKDLTEHVQIHKKDVASRRRLVMMVHNRRGMMQYLLRESPERYREMVKQLGIRPGSVFSKDVGKGAKKKAAPLVKLES